MDTSARLSVLLVEDSAAQGRFLEQTLRDMESSTPSDVTWVDTLHRALAHLASAKVDLVLLDLVLPDSDGTATFVALHEAHPKIPVIVLSGAGNEETALEAVAAGAQDYLAKRSLSPDVLQRSIWYALARSKAFEAAEVAIATARDQAIEASRLKSQFLANMSHEIRTPMNGVLGFANLLIETDLDATQQNYLGLLRESAENLLGVIDDILDFSKVEAGKLELETIDFDLRAVLQTVIDLQNPGAEAKQLALKLEIGSDAPRWVTGDPARLRQILTNLMANAVKFTDSGHVRLSVGCGENGDVRFEVADTGIGIDECVSHLLDPFSQADASTTRRFGGTGLGLAICRQLVELMGGTLGYHSRVQLGSTFWFEVPLRRSTPERSIASSPQERGVDDGAKPAQLLDAGRVLLVDDSRVNQLVARAMLERMGFFVEVSVNGLEALAAASTSDYDVILMDCLMPEMDGYEATAQIRLHEGAARHTPIIAVTASAMSGDRQKCLEAGMDDYIAKPIYPATLAAVMQKWLSCESQPGVEQPVT